MPCLTSVESKSGPDSRVRLVICWNLRTPWLQLPASTGGDCGCINNIYAYAFVCQRGTCEATLAPPERLITRQEFGILKFMGVLRCTFNEQ